MKITLRVLLCLLVITTTIVQTAYALDVKEFKITNTISQKEVTDIDGHEIVWHEYVSNNNWEIMYFDGQSIHRLTENTWWDREPRIHDSKIVWFDSNGPLSDYYYYDGQVTKQTDGEYTGPWYGDIDEGLAVWTGWDEEDQEILIYDGISSTQLTDNHIEDRNPATSKGKVVWEADGIYLYDHSSGQTQLISPTGHAPDIGQGQIVWEDGTQYYDGTQLVESPITGQSSNPQIDNGQIVWRDQDHTQIYHWNGETTQSIFSGSGVGWPLIENDWITWRHGNEAYLCRNGETESFATSSYPVLGGGSISYYRLDGITTEHGTQSSQIYLTTSTYETVSITLHPGWNQVNFPVNTFETSVNEVLYELDNYIIYEYKNGEYITPSTIHTGKGYWIHVLEETTFNVYGIPWIDPSIELAIGWNLIGPRNTLPNFDERLQGYTRVLVWDGIKYIDTDTIHRGSGYWVYSSQNQLVDLN